jgi:hypothetical protein
MAYFGGAGVHGEPLHPSLRAYIDCFLSPPFPKMFPRGGGIWDQDPVLLTEFRIVQQFHDDFKESQQQMENAKSNGPFGAMSGGGGAGNMLGGALDQYLSQLGE